MFNVFGGASTAAGEPASTILQALTLMNGQLVSEVTKVGKGPTLTAVTEAPWMSDEERIRTLYLATLSRPPLSDELQRFQSLLKAKKSKAERESAFGTIFWVLLNSTEFVMNH